MIKSHKIEIKPNSQMKHYLEQCFGYNRKIYNNCITYYNMFGEINKKQVDEYNSKIEKEEDKIGYSYIGEYELKKVLDNTKYDWELELPSNIRDTALKRFWIAKERWSIHKLSNFPKYKQKNNPIQSFTYNISKYISNGFQHFNPNNPKKFRMSLGRKCNIPMNQRWIKMTESIRFKGKVKQIHIIKEYDRYFANFVIELDNEITKTKKEKDIIGLDVGIHTYIHDSNDKQYKHKLKSYNMIKYLKRAEYYHKVLMRKYDKTKKSWEQSKNYYKTIAKYRRVLRKIANGKQDFYHWITSKYSNEYTNIIIEDLNNVSMRKKKTNPNKSIRKQLSQVSFGVIKEMFENKAYNLIKCAQGFASTQICNKCGNRKFKQDKLTLNDRTYKCHICGYIENRDLNAALNIKDYGIK